MTSRFSYWWVSFRNNIISHNGNIARELLGAFHSNDIDMDYDLDTEQLTMIRYGAANYDSCANSVYYAENRPIGYLTLPF